MSRIEILIDCDSETVVRIDEFFALREIERAARVVARDLPHAAHEITAALAELDAVRGRR